MTKESIQEQLDEIVGILARYGAGMTGPEILTELKSRFCPAKILRKFNYFSHLTNLSTICVILSY